VMTDGASSGAFSLGDVAPRPVEAPTGGSSRAAGTAVAGELRGARRRTDFTPAERRLSEFLQRRLLDLLEGRRDRLELLRSYPTEPGRAGLTPTPPGLHREQLRPPVVERLIQDVLDFVRGDADGQGPIAQSVAAGEVVERQTLATRYRHILIERTDRYRDDHPEPVETAWLLRRVRPDRGAAPVERILCAASLAFELVRAIR